ncbi:MAG: Crp/Fnr family transcriptional regulator [Aquificaceae bacterium]
MIGFQAIDYFERRFGLKKIEKGEFLFHEGDACSYVPFLKEGKLKVFLLTENGREVFLYSLLPNQMCVLAMLCTYSKEDYPAYSCAEEDSLLIPIPTDVALNLFDRESWWRGLFMRVLSENLLSIMGLLNDMLSRNIESRLIDYLISHSQENFLITKRHEDIAREIGSVRVVISRTLKKLEKDGLVELRRENVMIKNLEALKRRANNAR